MLSNLHVIFLLPAKKPLHSVYQLTGTFANSGDPDEMLLYVAFHQGLHCLQR